MTRMTPGTVIGYVAREITVRGKGGKPRVVRIGHEAARALDRYLWVPSWHGQAWRLKL